MAINVGKSARMRFGPRFKNACADIVVSGHSIEWEMSARYLGVYLESSTKFKCSFSKNKAGFLKSLLIALWENWPQRIRRGVVRVN